MLVVTRQVAIKGPAAFKHEFTREHLGDVKTCLSFSGPADPLRGDEYSRRVREAAAAAIEALTSDGPRQINGPRMVGIGNHSYGGGEGGGMGGSLAPPESGKGGKGMGQVGGGWSGGMQGLGSEPREQKESRFTQLGEKGRH